MALTALCQESLEKLRVIDLDHGCVEDQLQQAPTAGETPETAEGQVRQQPSAAGLRHSHGPLIGGLPRRGPDDGVGFCGWSTMEPMQERRHI